MKEEDNPNRDQLLAIRELEVIFWEIYATTACNLQCTYCYNDDLQHKNSEPQYTLEELVSFLKKYGRKGDHISFIGGEPLIRSNWIHKVISATQDLGFEYGLYTNGVNLGKLSPDMLSKLKHILISIDGDEEQNDRFRGKGTFSKIIKHLEVLRPLFQGKIIARMTAAPDNDLEKSVKALAALPYFDTIYWQYQNMKNFDNYPVEQKWKELEKLLAFWLENLKQEKFLHIQTFVSMVIRLLDQENGQKYHNVNYTLPEDTLGCGAGNHYVQIFTTGDIYACPEIVEQKNNFMGDIRNGIQRCIGLGDFPNTEKCFRCEEFPICHCRCLHCTPEAYCTLIKRTIAVLRDALPLIKSLIDDGKIKREDFYISDQLEEIF
jgi:putative peptide-modifying radical SAM enzyme